MEEQFMKCKICNRTVKKGKTLGNKGCICNSCRQRYYQIKTKARAIEYKGGKCEICGYDKNQTALEFHHINPEEKEFNISIGVNKSWETIKPELDKCMLVCSNCHRELHHGRQAEYIIQEYEKWVKPLSAEEKDSRRIASLKAKEKRDKRRIEQEKKNEKRKQTIKHSNIDFSKYGWAIQLEPLLGIKSAAIVRWMKRHMPTFYREKCYKEKIINDDEINTIVNKYKSGTTIEKIAKEMQIDCGRVSLALKESGCTPQIRNAIKVDMIDPNTDQIIKIFSSVQEASAYCEKYIKSHHNQSTSLKAISVHISRCLNNRQKTAYGYKWKKSEDNISA